jgi:hypothetical protein
MVVNLILNYPTNWILDSGATDHITGNKKLINNLINWDTTQSMTVANGDKIKFIGSGSIDLFFKKLPNVLYVQDCPTNLLSINKIAQQINCEIIFTTKKVIFQDWNMKSVIGECILENGLYYLKKVIVL